MTITRHPSTPNITVAPGEVAVVGYSITYPDDGDDIELILLKGSNEVHNTKCAKFELDFTSFEEISNCTSNGSMKTDWYVLRINGTEDVDRMTVQCMFFYHDDIEHISCELEEVMITVTNGKEPLL